MNKEKNISKLNLVVIGLGIVMAFAVTLSPILKSYIPQQEISIEETQTEDDQEQDGNEAQVSTFDAVASVIQLNLIPDQQMTAELDVDHVDDASLIDEITKEFPRKLFNILFRRIISPNAP